MEIAITWKLVLIFAFGFLGIVAQFANRKYKGADISNVFDYFRQDFNHSVVVVIGYIGAFALLYEMGELGWFSAFGAGYMSDSFFNRYNGKPNGRG